MVKLYVTVLFLGMQFFTVARGDIIVLKDIDKKIDFSILGVTDEYVSVEIPKRDMKSLDMLFLQRDAFPDVIHLYTEEISLKCKVKEIKKDEIIVMIPTHAISSLQMSFMENGVEETFPAKKMHKSHVAEIGKHMDNKEERQREALESQIQNQTDNREEELTDELRTDIVGKSNAKKYYRFKTKKVFEAEDTFDKNEFVDFGTSADDGSTRIWAGKTSSASGVEEDKLLTGEVVGTYGKVAEEATVLQDANLGSVEGRILKSGKPIKDCQVQLRRLEKSGLLSREYRMVDGALELEVVTNDEGFYHFMNVMPGEYKLYWKPPLETTWVRRFKMEPDVIVESGKTIKPRDIEVLKRTLN
ncbi:MAG: carboxypeptidase-like regulatory domain-containing protein [Candidatus Kuenenia sp.]|nr:carboxypeptidase-like regulatory domain-containing protein [Candidatus Kuenenia sp.]